VPVADGPQSRCLDVAARPCRRVAYDRRLDVCFVHRRILSRRHDSTGGDRSINQTARRNRRSIATPAVERLVARHCHTAGRRCSSLKLKTVTPHVLRHTAAMELLQHGIDRLVIALWLGHESVETTQMYLHADLRLKEQALSRVVPLGVKPRRFRPDDELLAFLENLRLCGVWTASRNCWISGTASTAGSLRCSGTRSLRSVSQSRGADGCRRTGCRYMGAFRLDDHGKFLVSGDSRAIPHEWGRCQHETLPDRSQRGPKIRKKLGKIAANCYATPLPRGVFLHVGIESNGFWPPPR